MSLSRSTDDASAMIRLSLLAHAPTAAQREFRFPTDDERSQPLAPEVVERLLVEVGPCDTVVCAPECRSRGTVLALGLQATIADDLRAWSVGDWAGRALASLVEIDPDAVHRWQTDPDAAPPNGETLNALLTRVARWTEAQTSGARRALVIADPAVIRAVVVSVLGAPPASFWRFDVPPLSLSVVQHAAGQWRLRRLGTRVVSREPSAVPKIRAFKGLGGNAGFSSDG